MVTSSAINSIFPQDIIFIIQDFLAGQRSFWKAKFTDGPLFEMTPKCKKYLNVMYLENHPYDPTKPMLWLRSRVAMNNREYKVQQLLKRSIRHRFNLDG